MDQTEEDMKLVGFFGIFKHSFKTIFSYNKIFSQITLTLIIPLAIIFLAHLEISNRVFGIEGYLAYSSYLPYYRYTPVTTWLYYWLFKLTYFTLLIIFSVLSTAAIVFTIASIYTDREVVFSQLIVKVVPKVWKKLCITFIYIYFAMLVYKVMYSVVLLITRSIFEVWVLLYIILILSIFGFLYLTVVWQLASVATVLENMHGFEAMKKGLVLANRKKKVGMSVAFVLHGILYGLVFVYVKFVEYGASMMIWRVMLGVLCGILIVMLLLMLFVTQTVFYLVCKSHHGEVIGKLSLSTFLSGYMGETVAYLRSDEVIHLGRPLFQQVWSNRANRTYG